MEIDEPTLPELVEILRAEQQRRWQGGERVAPEVYFALHPQLLDDTACAMKMVYNEVLLREAAGEKPRLDEYLRRFPGLTDQLAPLFDVHRALESDELLAAAGGDTCLDRSWSRSDPPLRGAWPTIAGHEILGELGRGGMGVVYKARQISLNRLVALKMILDGCHAHPNQLARFRAEAQAVARLQHPNIVQIHEVAEQDGRPYFSLEFVDGGNLAQALNGEPQPARLAAGLIQTLARAIHAAHQRSIVHRDLKPANILLQRQHEDGSPVTQETQAGAVFVLRSSSFIPKITDFGLAKQLDVGAGLTATGMTVGTPSYMAPEQANSSMREIGPATDVYALGAILYELLTGRPPFRAETHLDTLRQVVGDDPVPLSRFHLKVPRDLNTICTKCLRKEPHKRYPSALSLAEDLERFLANQPIQARRTSMPEQVWRWSRRHPALACLAGLVVTVAVGASLAALRLRTEQDATLAQLHKTEEAQVRAEAGERLAGDRLNQVEAEKKKVEEEKTIAQTVRDFLQNKLLAQTDTGTQANALLKAGESSSGAKLNPTIRELLDRAAKELTPDKIEESFPKQPLIQAEILHTTGTTYLRIGEHQPAIDFLKRSEALRRQHLGPDHPETLESMNNLADAYGEAGKLDLALPLFEETLKISKAKPGPEHPHTLTSMNNLAAAYYYAGKLDLALPLLEETLKLMKAKLGPEHPDTLNTMNNLAWAYRAAGNLDLALPLQEETLKLTKAKLGPEHPDTLRTMQHLAQAYQAAGKFDLALPLQEETLKLTKAKLGPEHPQTLNTMMNLAEFYARAGKPDLALPLGEETLKLMKAKLGPEHPDTLTSMNNLAKAYREAGKLDLALPLSEETLNLRKAKLGPEHPDTLSSMNNLATAYRDAGKLDLALPLFEETLNLRKAKLGPEHPDTLTSMNNLAAAYYAVGKLDLALPLFEETLKLQKAKLGPEHPDTLISMGNLGGAYCKAAQGEKAAPILKEFIAGQRKRFPVNNPGFAGLQAQVALELLKCRQHPAAEEMLRECLAIREKTQPDVWSTFNTKSLLGGTLLGQKKYAEAEPLLLAGYEGMKQREKTIPPAGQVRLREAVDRLIELSTATNKPDEVKRWQAERAKYPEGGPLPREKKGARGQSSQVVACVARDSKCALLCPFEAQVAPGHSPRELSPRPPADFSSLFSYSFSYSLEKPGMDAAFLARQAGRPFNSECGGCRRFRFGFA